MIGNSVKRVVAIVFTAVLIFSTFIMIPQDTASAASEQNYFTIRVLDTGGIVDSASVILTDVHTGNTIQTVYWENISSYVANEPPAGRYRIDVSCDGHYHYKDITGIRYNGTGSYSYGSVRITEFGDTIYTYNVTVKDSVGQPIRNAEVKFYDEDEKQDIISNAEGVVPNTTDSSGFTMVNIFSGTFDLVVSASGYEANVTRDVSTMGGGSVTVNLTNSATLFGDVDKENGMPAANVVAYLYNTDPNLPWEKRVLKSTMGSFVWFDEAYPGEWVLVIDGSDIDPFIKKINIPATGMYDLKTLANLQKFAEQNQSTENIMISFSDWNGLTIAINGTWKADKTYYGFDYADIGCLRAQIDLALGNANGTIEPNEYSIFKNYLTNLHGPNYVATHSILRVNDTYYISALTPDILDLSNFISQSVTVTNDTYYDSNISYTSNDSLDTNSSIYTAEITVPYDSALMNRKFEIKLVSGYELVNNETFTSKVDVSGYMTVVVDPQYSSIPGSETVGLDLGRSEKPTAEAKILTTYGGGVAYKKMNNTTILYYVVKNDTAIRFSSVGSHDPNDNPITFTWNFGDGSENTTDSIVFDYNFTAAAENLTVTLTVDDVSGMTNNTSFQLYVDALSPRAIIDVWNQTGEEITIDQGDSLEFSPTGSVDDLVNVSDEKGEILTYEWTFGDEGVEVVGAEEDNLTVSHEFNIAGNVTVVLNITDVVTNWANATVKIVVIDTTSPIPSLDIPQNETGGTSLKEKSPVFFNANGTTDNFYDLENLTFEWDFGDGSDLLIGNGSEYAIVNHTFTSYGQYDITLNVTDERDNTGTLTQKVSIGSGPRPRLEADKIAFDPLTFEEGKIGTITVNITNDGSAVAKNITIEIWYYSLDIPQELIGTTTTIFDENGTVISSLEVGDSGYGIFQWTPSAKGNYSLRVYVNSTDQINPNWEPGYIVVNEAGWKKTALYGGVLAIFIVIPLLLFVRRRIASGGGVKRMPKEKKERKK